MNHRVPIFVCAAGLSLAVTLALPACTSHQRITVPDTLAPGANETLALVMPASGVQIYECRAKKDVGGHEWAFVAPEAELFDARGNVIGRHGAGPSWWAADGSRVTATVKARANAPTEASIPWLLLAAKSSPMPGTFSHISSIQRVNTEGGVAPAAPCTAATAGQEARVRYAAEYRFFTAN
jgi:hypothetical protein